MKIGISRKSKRDNISLNLKLLTSMKETFVSHFIDKYNNAKSFIARRKIKKEFKKYNFEKFDYLNSLLELGQLNKNSDIKIIYRNLLEVYVELLKNDVDAEEVQKLLDDLLKFIVFAMEFNFVNNHEIIHSNKKSQEELCVFVE